MYRKTNKLEITLNVSEDKTDTTIFKFIPLGITLELLKIKRINFKGISADSKACLENFKAAS